MSDVWESAGLVTEVWESNSTPGVVLNVVIRDGDIVATAALADLTDVDVTSDPPAQDDVLAWDDTENKWTPATLDGGVALSDATPQDLGTAAAGVSEDAARADHVHDMPTPAQIGALPDDTVIPDITGLQATSEKNQPNGYAGLDGDGTIPDNRIPSSIARDTEIGTQITAHDGSGTAHPDIRALMLPTIPHVPGRFYSLSGGQSVSTYAALGTGRLAAHPVWLPAGTYNRADLYTAVAAVATYRAGIYPSNPTTLLPDGETLIAEFGAYNMNATAGIQSVSITLTIPATGLYWLAVLSDSQSAAPSLSGWNGNNGMAPSVPWLGALVYDNPGARPVFIRLKTSVATGAMPSTFPTASLWGDQGPQVKLGAS